MATKMRNRSLIREPKPGAERALAERSRTHSARRRNPNLNRSYIVPVLSKALVIMDVLERVAHPLTMKQISNETGISLSTVYRIVRTLSAHGCLSEYANKTYSLRHVGAVAGGQESQERSGTQVLHEVIESDGSSAMASNAMPPARARQSFRAGKGFR